MNRKERRKMSSEVERAKKRAAKEGTIVPRKPIRPEDAAELVASEFKHPDPMLNYMVEEARKLTEGIANQQKMLQRGLAQMESLKQTILATKGARQKLIEDIAEMHKFSKVDPVDVAELKKKKEATVTPIHKENSNEEAAQ
jgi:hypothetical protein